MVGRGICRSVAGAIDGQKLCKRAATSCSKAFARHGVDRSCLEAWHWPERSPGDADIGNAVFPEGECAKEWAQPRVRVTLPLYADIRCIQRRAETVARAGSVLIRATSHRSGSGNSQTLRGRGSLPPLTQDIDQLSDQLRPFDPYGL